jgi:(2Fe-2S) ferredoxin
MDITRVHLIPRTLEAVHYTEETAEAVRQWVQDHSSFNEIVRDRNSGRLYIPVGGDALDIVEYGEYVLHEPGTGNFISTTPEAFHEFYEEED